MGMNLHFCGLANYKRLLVDPIFLSSVKNTFLYLIVQVPVMLLLAMLYAVLLNDKKLKFSSFFRIAIFLPCVTSLVAYAAVSYTHLDVYKRQVQTEAASRLSYTDADKIHFAGEGIPTVLVSIPLLSLIHI